MKRQKPSIVFMGTPEFAVPSLEVLIRNEYPVKAVVTAPDRPSGRGLRMKYSAVKNAALQYDLAVIQPSKLKDDDFIFRLKEISADIFVVVAFRMLPEKVWSLPPMGTVNLHASLLPLYRGAAPINHAIINGEEITGVTTFIIEKEIDTGNILMQEKEVIHKSDTAGTVHDRLMHNGANLLERTIAAMAKDQVEPKPQDEIVSVTYIPKAPKLTTDFCRITWSSDADRIYDFVRGLSPYPAAWTILVANDRRINVKIIEVKAIAAKHALVPGSLRIDKHRLMVAAGSGFIEVIKLKPEGRKQMTGPDFIRGFRPGEDPVFV